MAEVEDIVVRLEALATPENKSGMKRFAVGGEHTLGVRIPDLRKLARELGRDHGLAAGLWKTGIHEARILASMVDEPGRVTKAQLERWVKGFDSWDVTDQVCMNLFEKTPFAWELAVDWTHRKAEFEKRAGFALMACLAWHDKESPAERFTPFFDEIERAADDDRNFVKKAVNWALRNLGTRDPTLHAQAIAAAERIAAQDSKPARWIARDALRELRSDKVLARLEAKSKKKKRT